MTAASRSAAAPTSAATNSRLLSSISINNSKLLSNINTIHGTISINQGNTRQSVHHHHIKKKTNDKSKPFQNFKLRKRPSDRLKEVFKEIDDVNQLYAVMVRMMIYFPAINVADLFIKCYEKSLEEQKSTFIQYFTNFMNRNKQIAGSSFHSFVDKSKKIISSDYIQVTFMMRFCVIAPV